MQGHARAGARERERSRMDPIEKVDLHAKLASFSDHWSPKVVAELNGQQVKLAKFVGEFVWHHHDHEDELFMVLKGRFRMDFRDRQVWLEEGEILVVVVPDELAHEL